MKTRRKRAILDKPGADSVQEWVEGNLKVVSKSGREIQVLCPDCRSDRCYVNPREAVYVCFKCGERGTATILVAKTTGVSQSKAEAVLRRAGGDLDSLLAKLVRGDPPQAEPKVNQPLPAEYVPCFDGTRWRVPKYLTADFPRGRALCAEDLIEHGIGFCKEGRYRDRVVIPVSCDENRSFQGRLMGREADFAWVAQDGKRILPPKYLTERGARLPHMVWGWDLWRPGEDVVLVEVGVDRIRLVAFGVRGSGTMFGKELGEDQIELIRRKDPASVTFAFDAGSGFVSALQAAQVVRTRLGVPARVAALPPGEDPDTLGWKDPGELHRVLGAALEYGPDDALAAILGAPVDGNGRSIRRRKRTATKR